MSTETDSGFIRWFDDINKGDTDSVGGKNASLGEMIGALTSEGVRTPGGFALTAHAYRTFIEHNALDDRIQDALEDLETDKALRTAGERVRGLIMGAEFPEAMRQAVEEAYATLGERHGMKRVDVAVRSSATAEDLPDSSFAGQLESYLNVTGDERVLEACKMCFASLFTDRAISYREERGFDHLGVAVSVGVQKMVRADSGGSGVMFSIDTESGFPDTVVINAAWGLGENVVQGAVDPDEYRVFKPLLSQTGVTPIIGRRLGKKQQRMGYSSGKKGGTENVETKKKDRRRWVLGEQQVLELARWAVRIEKHYGYPVDIEWALDGETGELHVVQARPETVESRKKAGVLKTYTLRERNEPLVTGLAIGGSIASGKAFAIDTPEEGERFERGGVLVTRMTDPDWMPIMRRAAGIVTDLGGRTSHAAIVSRELGVPAVIGAGDASKVIDDGATVTVNCSEGDTGFVHPGHLDHDEEELDLADIPETRTHVMMNIASPDGAERWWRLPSKGVGLARVEFIIGDLIGVHPLALTRHDELVTKELQKRIDKITQDYDDREEFFVDKLALGVARIAAANHPHRVIVRLSDFKTNEYAGLIGGAQFEPDEENPMLGFRGASRYYSEEYKDGFALECRAMKRVREKIGLKNVSLMIPFCRTIGEADRVLEALSENGLTRGEDGLEVYMMAEIPSNVVLASQFAERFDGFSIGTNDLTQFVLGVDRDSSRLAHVYDERNEAVKIMIRQVIERAHEKGRSVGICGQAPSDHPDFAAFLVECGIDSISVNPDSVLNVVRSVAEAEAKSTAVS